MVLSARIVLLGLGVTFCPRIAHAQHMNSPKAPCRNVATTVDVSNCFGIASKDADRKLNQVYAQVLSSLQAEDQQNLRAAQRLWLQFRDATCRAERSLYGQGTGAPPLI